MSRILVVEDEPALVLGLRDRLESEGHEVDVAEDGDVAMERVKAGGFDLVLLDLMLPKRPGRDVLEQMRGAGDRTPVIVLTARTREEEKVDLLDLGADDYVTKPFGAAELAARVRAALRRAAPTGPTTARIGSFEVDLAAQVVRHGESERGLTPLESQILGIFLRSRGRVVSRAEILEEIWGVTVAVETRTVDFHVMKIRRLVEEDPRHPRHLVTVHGSGYRLNA